MKRETFLQLANIHDTHCISIYLPMENADKDKIRLKNHIQQAEQILEKTYDLDNRQITAITDRIWKVAGSLTYHSQAGRGMAIFAYGDEAKKFDLHDMEVPDKLYIADHLYVVPLVDAIDTTLQSLLLQLSADQVKLYTVKDNSIEIHPATRDLPKNIHDVIGHDVEQKSLQHRQGQQGSGGGEQSGMYHGHGAGSDSEQKEEYRKYFRAIDKVITDHIDASRMPLRLAAVDYLIPMYQEVSNYANWHEEHLEGNFDDAGAHELLEAIHTQVDHKSNRDVDVDAFEEKLSKHEASYQEHKIVEAAIEGRVQMLMVERGSDVFGRYDKSKAQAELEHFKTVDNTSLVNLAVIRTIENGGDVMLIEKTDMPEEEHVLNAIFRYQHG